MNNGPVNGLGPGPGVPHYGPPPHITGRGGPPPSPPASIARSSNGTGLYPASGHEGGKKYSAQVLEQQLQEHHRVLKDFLSASVREDHTYQPHHRARDKLLRLSPIQFQELSTDVYDELLRREDERAVARAEGPPSKIPRFLPNKPNFHPKRNQARQKLSTLASKKFRELATDVLFELERRFPRFAGGERFGGPPPPRGPSRGPPSRPGTSHGMHGPPPLGPMPHQMRRPSTASNSSAGPYSPGIFDSGRSMKQGSIQSNMMVPNKGTMVEDDDDRSIDDDDPYDLDRATARSSRRNTNKSLAYSIREQNQAEISALESKVEELEAQLRQKDEALESERKQAQSYQSINGSLQREIETLKMNGGDDDWKDRYETLEQEFHEHRQVTEEVRHEAMQSLQQMRSLSQKVQHKNQHEETLTKQVSDLQASVEDWKERHARTRAQLRTMRASSMGLFIQQPTATQFAQQGGLLDAKGLIRDTSVTRFQIAIDDLMQISRGNDPTQVLPFMGTIVSSVRTVTADIDMTNFKGSSDTIKRCEKLKARTSSTTNHLITTAKHYSVSNGLAPVSLLDAAASHLTTAIIELIKTVKIRPTPEGELENGQDGFF